MRKKGQKNEDNSPHHFSTLFYNLLQFTAKLSQNLSMGVTLNNTCFKHILFVKHVHDREVDFNTYSGIQTNNTGTKLTA